MRIYINILKERRINTAKTPSHGHVQLSRNSPIPPLDCLIFLETNHWVKPFPNTPQIWVVVLSTSDVICCCPVALMLCLAEPARSPLHMSVFALKSTRWHWHQTTNTNVAPCDISMYGHIQCIIHTAKNVTIVTWRWPGDAWNVIWKYVNKNLDT